MIVNSLEKCDFKKCNLFVVFDNVGKNMECTRLFANIFNKYIIWIFSYKDNCRWNVVSIIGRSNCNDFHSLSELELNKIIADTIKDLSRNNTVYCFDLNNKTYKSVKTKLNIDLNNYSNYFEYAINKCLDYNKHLKENEESWKLETFELNEINNILSYIRPSSKSLKKVEKSDDIKSNKHTVTLSNDTDDINLKKTLSNSSFNNIGKLVNIQEANGALFTCNDNASLIDYTNMGDALSTSGTRYFAIGSGTATWGSGPVTATAYYSNDGSDSGYLNFTGTSSIVEDEENDNCAGSIGFVNGNIVTAYETNESAYDIGYKKLKDDLLARKVKQMAVVLDDYGLVDFVKDCLYEVVNSKDPLYMNDNLFVTLKSPSGKTKMINIKRLKIMDVYDEPPKKI